MKKVILTIIIACSITICYGQSEKYTGTVLMGKLVGITEGVEVKIKGDGYKLQTTVNDSGEFYINNPVYPFKVILSSVNIKKSSHKVNSKTDNVFIVNLKSYIEVTVTGRANRATRLMIENKGSVHSVDIIEPRKTDVSMESLINRLRTIPGVTVVNRKIRIRGSGSINSGGEPILVIDGLVHRFESSSSSMSVSLRPSSSRPSSLRPISSSPSSSSTSSLLYERMLDLNIDDIKSIRVLKGADVLIYGRGNEGAIVIETKSGQF